MSAKANGLSGGDMTRPEVTKNGGLQDENMTPNQCKNDVQIKAWQGRRQSNIPSPPNSEAVAVTPRHGMDEVRISLRAFLSNHIRNKRLNIAVGSCGE